MRSFTIHKLDAEAVARAAEFAEAGRVFDEIDAEAW